MYQIEQTALYSAWFRKIQDKTLRGRIVARIERVQLGSFGDAKSVATAFMNFGWLLVRGIASISRMSARA